MTAVLSRPSGPRAAKPEFKGHRRFIVGIVSGPQTHDSETRLDQQVLGSEVARPGLARHTAATAASALLHGRADQFRAGAKAAASRQHTQRRNDGPVPLQRHERKAAPTQQCKTLLKRPAQLGSGESIGGAEAGSGQGLKLADIRGQRLAKFTCPWAELP